MDPSPFGLLQADYDEMLQAIRSFPDITKVTLFGSRAKGTDKPGSDVDLAIETDSTNNRTAIELAIRLNEETPLPYMFDVIDHQQINEPALLDHIERVGVVIYP
ncbi:nucleotidyltransferase family protein [Pelovirga terrestris]|uniref:Nucleotidyltransferase domain-containing protein n=1 Tax=Pelovirga terrestris TaxID=2771352 RepID=A0A8J6QNJ9_9BACT|nr:nucleotidyltransferase domain-containing protein [Pelovirga terrestris]MBD1399611.1 nucleotidyltransferase domain-containing protein [Pelovirga terrestris]